MVYTLANLTNLAIFTQITSCVTRVDLTILTNFSQIRQNKLAIFMESSMLFLRSKSVLSKQNTSLKSGARERNGKQFIFRSF